MLVGCDLLEVVRLEEHVPYADSPRTMMARTACATRRPRTKGLLSQIAMLVVVVYVSRGVYFVDVVTRVASLSLREAHKERLDKSVFRQVVVPQKAGGG